jgi:hypothetical protein
MRAQWPRDSGAAYNYYEISPPQLIISSERSSKRGVIVGPNASSALGGILAR